MESPHIIGYIILFLPLIFAFLCLLANFKKNNFLIFCANNFLVLGFTAVLIFLLPNFQTQIISNISHEIISVVINYNISFLSLFFIILITTIQLLTVIFYQKNLQNYFPSAKERLFYALNLVNLFAIIGIFTTDNIINLYILIEIYSITFYSLTCISRNKSLNNLALKYFYQGSIGSMLLIFSCLLLFINFGSANFAEIFFAIQNIGNSNQEELLLLIFIIFIFGLLLKFFPFWLHYKNLKNRDPFSHFLLSQLLFIKSNIGFYLLLKFLFLLFDSRLILSSFGLNLPFFAASFFLIFYSNFQIFISKNFQKILYYFCLTYIGFFLICLTINNNSSVISAFSFILSYNTIGLILLFICGFMHNNFKNCRIDNLNLLKNSLFLFPYLFLILVFLICALPPTILSLANLHLLFSLSEYNYFSLLILIPVITTFLVFYNLSLKMLSEFYFRNSKMSGKFSNNLQDNIPYLISFLAAILIILVVALNPKIFLNIFRNLSFYLK